VESQGGAIRRDSPEYEFGVGTISGVAYKLGVHRRMVRQALADARPPERKRAQRRRPVIECVIPFIESILEGDRQAPLPRLDSRDQSARCPYSGSRRRLR
jgi:hypothetical protein